MRKPDPTSNFKPWRECEREFKAQRDPKMKVTLPKLQFLEDHDERERTDNRRAA